MAAAFFVMPAGRDTPVSIVSVPEFAAFIGKTSPPEFNENLIFETILNSAEQAVCNWLGRKFTDGEVIELLPVGKEQPYDLGALDYVRTRNRVYAESKRRTGLSALKLSKPPVLLTGLRIWVDIDANAGQADGAFADETELTAGTDFFLDVAEPEADVPISESGIVYRAVGMWPQVPRSIKAQYTSGANAAWVAANAAPLKFGILATAGNAYRTYKTISDGRGPVTSERIGSYSYSTGGAAVAALLGGGGSVIPAAAQQVLAPLRSYGGLL